MDNAGHFEGDTITVDRRELIQIVEGMVQEVLACEREVGSLHPECASVAVTSQLRNSFLGLARSYRNLAGCYIQALEQAGHVCGCQKCCRCPRS